MTEAVSTYLEREAKLGFDWTIEYCVWVLNHHVDLKPQWIKTLRDKVNKEVKVKLEEDTVFFFYFNKVFMQIEESSENESYQYTMYDYDADFSTQDILDEYENTGEITCLSELDGGEWEGELVDLLIEMLQKAIKDTK